MSKVRWLPAFGAFLLIEVLMIGAAFSWVAIYSYVLEPGHDVSHYEAYAQRVSPWVSLAVGVPVFFGAGRLLRRFGTATALGAGIMFVVLDLVIVIAFAGEQLAFFLLFSLVNHPSKLAAIWFGARRPADAA